MARLLTTGGDPLPLDPKTPTTIGSGSAASLRLTDPEVAEIHCVLRSLQDGGFGLKDLGSPAGTRVNGRNIRAIRLGHGDRIQIGAQEIVFEDPESAAKAKPAAKTQAPAQAKPAAPTKPAPRNGNGDNDPWLTGTTQIAGYQVHSLLGSGGMGRVYEATQLSLHRKVAFKVLNPKLAEDPKFVESFLLEARASARFNHPNVVQVFDVDDVEGRPFYSMELLQESLEERLKREGSLPPEDAIRVVRDAAEGLAYAEQLGLVHRDVKPDNLMTDKEGRTKLCDLGLASSHEQSHQGKAAGTPHFMSPEQIRKEPLDQRSDLYSLGCTFWRLLTGKNVFSGKTVRDILKAQLETPAPKLREVQPEASEALEAILVRLLAKDPDERYAHASELAADLQVLADGQQKSHRALAFALGGLVLVLAVVVIVMINMGPEKEIRVITENDPNRAVQQQKLRESNAEVALLRVPKTGPLEDRAKAFEKVAKEHPGTKASEQALRQAKQLRQEQVRLATAAREAKQRIDRLVLAVQEAGTAEQAAGRLEAAWRMAQTAAGKTPRPAAVSQALDARSTALTKLLEQRIQKALGDLGQSLSKKDADPVALRESFDEALHPRGKDLEWTLPGAIALVQPQRARGADEIRKIVVARATEKRAEIQRQLDRRRDLLLGKGAALELLAAHRFAEATKVLRSLPAPQGMEKLWRGILDLAEISEDAQGALEALLSSSGPKGNPRTFDLQGQATRFESFDGKILVLSTGKGRRRKKRDADPWKEAALLEQLLAPGQKLAATVENGRQALVLILNFLDLVPQGQILVHGSANGGAPEQLPLDRGRMSLLEKTAFTLPAFAREGEALQLLGQLLKAWNGQADLLARDAIRRLEESHPTSAVGIALGIPAQSTGSNKNEASGKPAKGSKGKGGH